MSGHQVTPDFLANNPLPLPQGEVDKDARGRVVVVGGNSEIPGGVLLAGVSALRAGAGKVQIATVESTALALAIAVPEARVIALRQTGDGEIDPGNAKKILASIKEGDAVLLGPGMMDQHGAGALATAMLEALQSTRLVLDAAALTGLCHSKASLKRHAGRTVLTPHAGEMATFLGIERDVVMADPEAAARQAAAETGSIVVMKGSVTHIASPQGEVWTSRHGNVGLATSGSGDTLAGIIAGLLARGTAPLLAARWGVYLHAEAGARLKDKHGLLGFLAREIPGEIPAIMQGFAKEL